MKNGAILLLLFTISGYVLADERLCGAPARDADGAIIRSRAVLRAFEREWPRAQLPMTSERWILDHVIPLACGGCDSVENLQYLPESAWRAKSRWERKAYGGRGISESCP